MKITGKINGETVFNYWTENLQSAEGMIKKIIEEDGIVFIKPNTNYYDKGTTTERTGGESTNRVRNNDEGTEPSEMRQTSSGLEKVEKGMGPSDGDGEKRKPGRPKKITI